LQALHIPPPRRALVVKLGHIGDVLVTTPVFTALKQAWPGLRITALVNQGTEAMVSHSPFVDEVLVLQRGGRSGLAELGYQWRLLGQLRRRRFDLALELSGGDRGAFLTWASRSRLRVGFAPKSPHFRARLFHCLADSRGTDNHVVQTLLRQARLLGIEPRDLGLKFYPGQQAQAEAAGLRDSLGLTPGGYALVHPTSRWMFKTWTPQGNATAMAHLCERGLPVVITSAPAEHERRFVGEIKNALPDGLPVHDLAEAMDLPTLGAMIQGARIFLGVDSAPMHMAAALGVPVVALFGPSGEKMWGPWHVEHEVVTRPEPCRPCGRDGCDGSKVSRCLVEITPGQVCDALDRLLARTE
jgi:heptosyltransferase III